LSTHKLSEWEESDNQPSAMEKSLQGKKTTFSDEQTAFVVKLWKSYAEERKKVKINAFMKHLREQWKRQSWLTPAPSRKTVEDMLLANDCRKRKIKPNRRRRYHPKIKRYFPHAQTVLDGKQVIVSLNDQDFVFVLEFCKDMATDAIGGYAIGKSETAELVKQAFDQHCSNHTKPLATLIDNGSGNLKAAIDLGAEGVLVIKAYPYRAESKGQIEGEFSLFEKKVSRIVIEGQNEKEQAMNILKTIAEIYLRLRNQTPRCSVCPFTPKKLSEAKLDADNAEKSYQALKVQQEKREKQAEQRLKVSQEFNDLVDSIVKTQKLTGDILKFKKSANWIELSTLKEAEIKFAAQSQRDNFDPGKRTMAYFFAIARNIQKEKDQAIREQAARRRYGLDQEAKRQRDKIANELALKEQQKMLEKQPHVVILNAIKCEMNLPKPFRTTSKIFKDQIDQAVDSILRRKNQKQRETLINRTHEEIMRLNEFSLGIRYEWIEKINEKINILTKNTAKVVTPI